MEPRSQHYFLLFISSFLRGGGISLYTSSFARTQYVARLTLNWRSPLSLELQVCSTAPPGLPSC